MTIWCNFCKRHVRAPCTFHHLPEDHRSSSCKRFRSTKGASKARRDHINHEIRNMRALLPVTQEDQERLSYLHSMAAICTYIRKSVLFQGLRAGEPSRCSLPYEAFLEALPGFILVTTAQGRLVYVSENVAEYTGFSMIDVLQGDSVYDMVERSDVELIRSSLETESNSSSERSFVCCMHTSKAFKQQHGSCCSMLIRGSFRLLSPSSPAASASSEPLFVALCTPTVNRLMSSDSDFCNSFNSTHRLDMRFSQLSDSASYLLGYSADELTGRSWYSLVHPEDLSTAANSHRSLMQADEGFQVEMVLRLQCADLSWTWIYIRANKNSELQSISCTNFIISETEVSFLQKKIRRDAFEPFLPNSQHRPQPAPQSQSYSSKCFKRQRTSSSRSEEPPVRVRRESERDVYCVLCTSSSPVPLGESPALFTPPYSPASSSSPLQQEELSHELLMDPHERTDQLLSSPEGSPSYRSYVEPQLTCHHSPADSLLAASEQTFSQRDFGVFAALSPLSSSSPTYDFPACTSDARLVPDCLSVSDTCESPVECASLHPDDFALQEAPHGGSVLQLHHVPHNDFPLHPSLLTPNQSSMLTEPNQYNEREQEEISILARQISSLASSFDMHHTLNPLHNVAQHAATSTALSACDWNQNPLPLSVALPKCESAHDDSIFKDIVARKSSASRSDRYQQGLVSRSGSSQMEHEVLGLITDDSLPVEQFTAENVVRDPFRLQLGLHDHNIGLHQLNRYMQSSLRQDGLAEQNLY